MKLLNRIYPYFAIVGSILLVTKIVLNKVLIVYLDYDLGNYNKIATIIIDIIILMFGIGLLNDKSIDNKRYWKTILLIFFVQIMVRYPFIVKGFQFNQIIFSMLIFFGTTSPLTILVVMIFNWLNYVSLDKKYSNYSLYSFIALLIAGVVTLIGPIFSLLEWTNFWGILSYTLIVYVWVATTGLKVVLKRRNLNEISNASNLQATG